MHGQKLSIFQSSVYVAHYVYNNTDAMQVETLVKRSCFTFKTPRSFDLKNKTLISQCFEKSHKDVFEITVENANDSQ